MNRSPVLVALSALLLLAVFTATSQLAQAQTFQVLHSFGHGDGVNPLTGVVIDGNGNLYGTSQFGPGRDGMVFRMVHTGSSWTFVPLHNFVDAEGKQPAGIALGPDGSLYGTNLYGGNNAACNDSGCGTVFTVSPPARPCANINCPWPATVLHTFEGGDSDGAYPWLDGVVFDQTGNLYGMTFDGGVPGCGVVYEISPNGGTWTYNVIHTFLDAPGDGGCPAGSLIVDHAGNLLGVTTLGSAGLGTVFQMSPSPSGWTETVLWNFPYSQVDGWQPYGALVLDAAGNQYGTTNRGGSTSAIGCPTIGCGAVYELSPGGGGWTETVLHSFDLSHQDAWPYAGLTADAAGNLYGTTAGVYPTTNGNVFKLTRSNGGWVYTSLHDFHESDGMWPYGNVAIDANGNLYGTTIYGGAYGYGVVWEITP